MKTVEVLGRLVAEQNGQGMAEYGLILTFIAIVVVTALGAIGLRLNGVYQAVRDAFPGGG
ncbi:MAG: Flp family type IVb pilin [Chitinophagales bacterium]